MDQELDSSLFRPRLTKSSRFVSSLYFHRPKILITKNKVPVSILSKIWRSNESTYSGRGRASSATSLGSSVESFGFSSAKLKKRNISHLFCQSENLPNRQNLRFPLFPPPGESRARMFPDLYFLFSRARCRRRGRKLDETLGLAFFSN